MTVAWDFFLLFFLSKPRLGIWFLWLSSVWFFFNFHDIKYSKICSAFGFYVLFNVKKFANWPNFSFSYLESYKLQGLGLRKKLKNVTHWKNTKAYICVNNWHLNMTLSWLKKLCDYMPNEFCHEFFSHDSDYNLRLKKITFLIISKFLTTKFSIGWVKKNVRNEKPTSPPQWVEPSCIWSPSAPCTRRSLFASWSTTHDIPLTLWDVILMVYVPFHFGFKESASGRPTL